MKTYKFLLFLSLLSVWGLRVQAQSIVEENAVGKTYRITSEALSSEREIQVYLPPGYMESPQRNYPVMYVMDSQEYFLHPIAFQDMLRFRDKSPDFIVVGIKTDRRLRRTLFYEKADTFIRFLNAELIPFVDSEFRTQKEKERIFFGWEMAGGLGIEIAVRNPGVFSAYLLASSTHMTRERLDQLANHMKSKPGSPKYLLATKAPEEDFLAKSMAALDSILQANPSGILRYTIRTLEGDDHYTTPTKTIHDGLIEYFSDYKPIRFYTLKEYDDYGGLPALRSYYKNRGERFSVDTELHRETKHFLLLNAMNENNYDRFEYYNRELGNYVETQVRRDFWVKRYADFYLKNEQTEKALSVYQAGLKKFSESPLLHNGIGELYKAEGDKHKASEYLIKAVQLAEEKKDTRLEQYRKSLEGLN